MPLLIARGQFILNFIYFFISCDVNNIFSFAIRTMCINEILFIDDFNLFSIHQQKGMSASLTRPIKFHSNSSYRKGISLFKNVLLRPNKEISDIGNNVTMNSSDIKQKSMSEKRTKSDKIFKGGI